MSTIQDLTIQLGSTANCNSSNCCSQISSLSDRISAMESKLGSTDEALRIANETKSQAATLAIGLVGLTGTVGGLSATVSGISAAIIGIGAQAAAAVGAGVALAAQLAPIIVAVAAIAGIGIIANQAIGGADEAKRIAGEALGKAQSALSSAGSAIAKSESAISIADFASSLSRGASAAASEAKSDARSALDAANRAVTNAASAISAAATAKSTADLAAAAATAARDRANIAIDNAGTAISEAQRAIDIAISNPGIVGQQGIEGRQGERGFPGLNGAQGIQGERGEQGIEGKIGARGERGEQGIEGRQGERGFPGLNGTQGVSGVAGAPGLPGSRGIDGISGFPGLNGAQGVPGVAGVPGIAGAPGKDAVLSTDIPERLNNLEDKVRNLPDIVIDFPPDSITVRRPTTGEIVRLPTDGYIQGEFVEVKSTLTRYGGDLEPLKNDNENNKRAIAVIQSTCCNPDPKPEPKVELSPVLLQKFIRCDDNKNPVYATYPATVIKGTEIKEQTQALQLAQIEAQQCKDYDLSLSVPEWWQSRVENFRPQLIISYRVIQSDGSLGGTRYSITLPHPTDNFKSKPPTKPTMPAYEKGNYQGILKLRDNSSIIVNAKDTGALSSLMAGLVALIDPAQVTDKSYKTVIHPPGTFNEARLKPWQLDFYAAGRGATTNKGLRPNWSWRL